MSSTFDGPWGISAALQLAAAETLTARLRARHARAVRGPLAAAPSAPARRDAAGAARARGWAWTWTRTRWQRCSWSGSSSRPAKVGHEPRHVLRALEVGRVAGVLDEREAPLGRGGGHPLGGARVGLVAGARERQERRPQRLELEPDRVERPLARGAEQEGELTRVVAQPALALCLHERVALVGEQRLALPDAHDLGDRHASPSSRRAARRPRHGRCGPPAPRCPRMAPIVTTPR